MALHDFEFEIAGSWQPVRLQIFDAQDRLVRTLVNAEIEAGRHATTWDGRDDGGREAGSSVYFIAATVSMGQGIVDLLTQDLTDIRTVL